MVCTFGIMEECRNRIHIVDKVDLVWLTCCALHNRLLDIVSLNSDWSGGVEADSTTIESKWFGKLGRNYFEGIHKN